VCGEERSYRSRAVCVHDRCNNDGDIMMLLTKGYVCRPFFELAFNKDAAGFKELSIA
jgi:hypothetical protein